MTASDGGNSIIAIVWHLAGNLESRFTDFRTSDGEKPWRDRDDEFVLRTVTKCRAAREMGAGMARAARRARRTHRRRSAGHGHDSSSAAAHRSGAAAVPRTHRLSHRPDRLPGQADSQRRLAMSEYSARRDQRRTTRAALTSPRRPTPECWMNLTRSSRRRRPGPRRRTRRPGPASRPAEARRTRIPRDHPRARGRDPRRRDGDGGSAPRPGASSLGASTETQFTPDAVSVVRSSDERGPTVTSPESASIFSTYSGDPVAMPSPLRWPIVKRCTPSCAPSGRATLVENRAAASPRRSLCDERRVVAVGHEADLLAVGLVGDREPEPARLGAHGRLRQRAHREQRSRQLLLRQREQEVRLVLVAIDAALEQPSSVVRRARCARSGRWRRARSRIPGHARAASRT